MPDRKRRYNALCRQLLALGTVVAVAAPGATVAPLDIVGPKAEGDEPGPPVPGTGGAAMVAAEPVRPEVAELPLRGVERAGLQALTPRPRVKEKARERLAALSEPTQVHGYATVGVTWKPGQIADEEDIKIAARTREDGEWSAWQEVEYHDEHRPDAHSPDARTARPGTDALVIGDVDEVQVKVVTEDGTAPAGMRLAVVDPGRPEDHEVERPDIDTAELMSAQTPGDTLAGEEEPVAGEAPLEEQPAVEDVSLTGSAASVTPRPKIFSRAQWGADERLRDRSSLRYYAVHAGFVHHTVNANDYSRSQVPAIIRSIYAYHTQSLGWSDIGYNFLVDRFGRIWEGRYGGVARPVVGAHTYGYNDHSFAMSAIGNFEKVRPRRRMVEAYGRLFAWKLALHGVDAADRRQRVGSSVIPAVNGHRDVGQTACPGRFLYARVDTIRRLANNYQKPFGTRDRDTDISASRWPDFVVRDERSRRGYVVRTGGMVDFHRPRRVGRGWGGMDKIVATPDLTGDGRPDIVARDASTGRAKLYPGNREGRYGPPVWSSRRFRNLDNLVAVGDLTGDGSNDLVGRSGTAKSLHVYPGNGKSGFRSRRRLSADWSAYNLTAGAGDLTGDGRVDLVARDRNGRLWLWKGDGKGHLTARSRLRGRWGRYDVIAGVGDATNDRFPDLVARERRSQRTRIFPGDGRGGLRHSYGPYRRFRGVDFLAIAGDVRGNRRNDLIGRGRAGRLVVFTNDGQRNLLRRRSTGDLFPGADLILNVGDWNRDGHNDLMTRSAATGYLSFRAGQGRNRFAAPARVRRGWGRVEMAAAVGDVTGDGYPDLMAQRPDRAMRIFPGNGRSGFRRSYRAHSSIPGNVHTGVGLWSRDGAPDTVVRRSGWLVLYPGNGPGGLMDGRRVASRTGRYDWVRGAGDVDGDGRNDLVVRLRRNGTLWLLPGTRSGKFGPRRYIGAGFGRYDLSS